MLGLPSNTEIKMIIPKKQFYGKLSIGVAEQKVFDEYIKQLVIVHEISNRTIPSLNVTEHLRAVFVLKVILKQEDCPDKLIEKLSKLVDQKLILALTYGQQVELVVYYKNKLRKAAKQNAEALQLRIDGADIEKVWENLIAQTSDIKLEEGKDLQETVANMDAKTKLANEIAKLTKRMGNERQPRKKLELRQEINRMKKEMEAL